jgi:16S rRNA (cytosine967-C5)-methyltransferase
MRLPEHAALSETVNSCKSLGKPWATGLINASLRTYQRNQQQLESTIENTDKTHYAHPDWILNQLQHDWPESWQTIVHANNQQAPMTLRVNRQQNSRDDYLNLLKQQGFKAKPIAGCADGIELDQPCDVNALPEFLKGAASVQDGAAQHTVELLDIKQNQRILDACAAPGGKTCHILEVEPSNEVVAIDIDSERLLRITENLQRLNLSAELIAADASDVDAWWDKKMFDRILIDAPCSGTGVIRRHPDIKVLRRPSDLDDLVNKQQHLLEKLWPLLNTGGLIVYTTCSVFKQENELQIMSFLKTHPEAEEVKLSPEPASPRPVGYQRLPGDDNMDGFFYACIRKV